MDDVQLINLYFERSEAAIKETESKYGKYCMTIAGNVLHNREDSEEVVNDAYLALWNSIPPERPNCFKAFLAKITRNIALDKYEKQTAAKRGGGNADEAIDEFAEILPAKENTESEFFGRELTRHINAFLSGQTPERRKLFVRRYFYMSSIDEIAEAYGLGQSNVKVTLMRMREALKEYLKKEGYTL